MGTGRRKFTKQYKADAAASRSPSSQGRSKRSTLLVRRYWSDFQATSMRIALL